MTSNGAVADPFAHIRDRYRDKVRQDLLGHIDADNKWDASQFDPPNDYQRHLYALFLKLAGRTPAEILKAIHSVAGDVAEHKREQYALDVLHSEIVGISRADGSLLPVQGQEAPRLHLSNSGEVVEL